MFTSNRRDGFIEVFNFFRRLLLFNYSPRRIEDALPLSANREGWRQFIWLQVSQINVVSNLSVVSGKFNPTSLSDVIGVIKNYTRSEKSIKTNTHRQALLKLFQIDIFLTFFYIKQCFLRVLRVFTVLFFLTTKVFVF